MTAPKCTSWLGHKFEARYDLEAPTQVVKSSGGWSAREVVDVLDATRPQTYVHDICVRCGHVVITIINVSEIPSPNGLGAGS